ncbi:ribose transport system ATP-binding protein [Rhizobium beringeri]
MTEERPLLEARQVFRGFFGNPVLKGVDIALLPGRVHALLGENGAGKSTLINLLSGALQPDGGSILVDGNPVGRFSPSAARAAGIAVVQQELSLTASLSIAENIGLGAFPRRFGLIDYKALHRGVSDVCDMVGLTEPLDMPVADLALGRRQMVEIAKALFRKPRVLILDEPTSSLSAHEAGILARLIETLKNHGTALLYISHRLNEVQALCSHVTVLKDGLVTADQSLSGIDGEGLVRLMVGRETGDLFPPRSVTAPGAMRISVEGFSAGLVRDIGFSARAGEIVGIGGLVGQGQEDLLLGLYGAIPASAGRAEVSGKPALPADVGEANAAGIVYVPADRKHEGLVLPHSIASNLILPSLGRLARKGLRDRPAGKRSGRRSRAPADDQGRYGPPGAGAFRRQPAEGGARQMAAARSLRSAPQRSDPRRRHRDQAGSLPHAPCLRRRGAARHSGQFRYPRARASLRSCRGSARGACRGGVVAR